MTEAAPATEATPTVKKPPSVKRRTAEVIEIHAEYEYAVFTLDQQPDRNYFGLAIESSYGGYSYAWSQPGTDFRSFLARLNVDYVLGKMVGRDEQFDGEATAKGIRKDILELRRKRECSADEARGEWPDDFESPCDFERWCGNTELFKGREPWFYYTTGPGLRACQFTALYELFWPILAAELKKPTGA